MSTLHVNGHDNKRPIETGKRVAFVTGATGLLGSFILRALSKRGYGTLFVLVRGSEITQAEERVAKALQLAGLKSSLSGMAGLNVIVGDVAQRDLGISERQRINMLCNVSDIFHCAAITDLDMPYARIRVTNVQGTENALELARKIACDRKRIVRFHYVSSVTVAGNRSGWFSEDEFDCGQGFNNAYEKSKFEAEKLVRSESKEGLLDVRIYRPGIILGDSVSGCVPGIKMVYQPWRLLAQDVSEVWPADSASPHALITADKAADAIAVLSEAESITSGHAWHVIGPEETTLGRFTEVASKALNKRQPSYISLDRVKERDLLPWQWRAFKSVIPYLNYATRYHADATWKYLAMKEFVWPSINDGVLAKQFEYCVKNGLIRIGRRRSWSKAKRITVNDNRNIEAG